MSQEAGTTPEHRETVMAIEETLGHTYIKYKNHVDSYINFPKETRSDGLREAKVSAVLKLLQERCDALTVPKFERFKE